MGQPIYIFIKKCYLRHELNLKKLSYHDFTLLYNDSIAGSRL